MPSLNQATRLLYMAWRPYILHTCLTTLAEAFCSASGNFQRLKGKS